MKAAKFFFLDFFNYFFRKIISNDDLPSEQKNFLMEYYQISKNYDSYENLNISKNPFHNIISSTKNNFNKRVKPPKISIIIINSNSKPIRNIIKLLHNLNFDYHEIN